MRDIRCECCGRRARERWRITEPEMSYRRNGEPVPGIEFDTCGKRCAREAMFGPPSTRLPAGVTFTLVERIGTSGREAA